MQHKTNNSIDLISNNVKISQFIEQYVKLSKRGANFLGICPFHSEKTPSFTVSDTKKLFHCFGCKESGNIFQFAMKYHQISFKEALEQVAAFGGISLDQQAYKKLSARDLLLKELRELNNEAASVYHQEIKNSQADAVAYLKNRGITSSSVNQFLLGASPQDYSFLAKKIDLSSFHNRTVKASRLFYEEKYPASKQSFNDRFRNKVIFPIQNQKGDVIAFGSRVLDNSLPKYINSPETPLFKKRETLYGLFQAKEAIKEQQAVYITEGYFDVIAMHQNNQKNTVATLGTAISQQHIQILKTLTENIVLLFDGDSAGEKAAYKALLICLESDISPKFIICENGKDPYDVAMYYQKNLVQWLKQQTKSWTEFLLYKIQQETNPITQQKTVKSYLQSLEKINPFLSQSFAQSIGEYFQIPINTFLSKEYSTVKNSFTQAMPKFRYKEKSVSFQDKEKNTENLFVCLCLNIPNDFYQLQSKFNLSGAFFNTPDARELFSLFLQEKAFILEDFLHTLPDSLKNLVENYSRTIHAMENKNKALLDCYYSLQIGSLLQQETTLKQNLKTLVDENDVILTLQELEALNKKKKSFEEKIKNTLK